MAQITLSELRHTVRALARRPWTTVLAIAALGLGIGLTATMFSALEGIFLRGLPFQEAGRLVQIDVHDRTRGIERMPPSGSAAELWRQEAESFTALAGWYGVGMTVSGGDAPPERINGSAVTPGLLELLRVAPELGRGIQPADARPGADPVVVVSHRLWRDHLGADPQPVGRILRLHGQATTVVGVMPEGFHFPLSQDFWQPLSFTAEAWKLRRLQVIGRLADGVSRDQARDELVSLAAGLAAEDPEGHAWTGVAVRPYVEAYSDPEVRGNLVALLGAVFGVLLVACANVATLLLARGTERAGELAVRQALGAGRRRVVGQLLAEAAILAGGGGVVGVGLAWVGSELLDRLIQPHLRSFWIDVRLDWPTLLFVLGITLSASLAAGLAPALRLACRDPHGLLKGGTRAGAGPGRGRLLRTLVVAQVAACCALLTAAGLTVKSRLRLDGIDLGFDRTGLLAAGMSLPDAAYPDAASRREVADRLMARLDALPGVAGAALTSDFSLDRRLGEARVEVEGEEARPEPPMARRVAVTPGYLAVLGVRPLAGSGLPAGAGPRQPPVAVVEEGFARKHFGAESPVGRRLRFSPEEPWTTIVGVVPDLGSDRLPEEQRGFLPVVKRTVTAAPPPAVLVPFAQRPPPWATLVVRAAGDPYALAPRLRREAAAVDPDLALIGISTVEDELADLSWDYRLFSTALAVFSAASVLLAGLGLFGVMAFTVARRRSEIGVRVALGADRPVIVRHVLAAGLAQIAAGLGLGVALAVLLGGALHGLLFEVEPWDPGVLAAVAAALTAAGLAACWIPARRAAGVPPAAALRQE